MTTIALAGWRVDGPGAPARLPAGSTVAVREEIRRVLADTGATGLVCAAACGADILALEAAESLGLRARIVLPFSVDVFRVKSVADRGGDWSVRYGRLVRHAVRSGDLRVLPPAETDEAAFAETNRAILDEASRLPASTRVIAVIVWEGHARGPGDLTAGFADEARGRGLPVREILTA